MSHSDKSPERSERERSEPKRKGEKERESVGEKAVSGAAARLARVEQAAQAAPDESDTGAMQQNLAREIADQVYYLRASGENWNTIVGSLAEIFGLSEEEVRKIARPRDRNDKIGKRLAAAIISQAQILGDASTD